MKRREFIQKTLAGSAAISLMNGSACQDQDVEPLFKTT